MLNQLLQDRDWILSLSFTVPERETPACSVINFSVVNEDGEQVWTSVRVRLPERYEDFYELFFYNADTEEVISIKEPTFLVILHELIHGIQNLTWNGVDTDVHRGLVDQFNERFPGIIDPTNPMFAKFFAGRFEQSINWPDELSAMILGIQGTVANQEIVVSETQALCELLSKEDLLQEFPDLQPYQGCRLVPFGHGVQQSSPENIEFLDNLLRATRLIDSPTLASSPC
ncbi:MAG: hypothetical protein LBE99_01945 [Puniceicoccales bacterium]|jgi:hypothetical protein|nr:hypothetical protein [Puniceicoccales bacterium]